MNPEDVFPRRNLPPEAEEWGRTIEDRLVQAENFTLGQQESITGLNRNSAANLGSLARQLNDLKTQVDRVDALNRARPQSFAKSASASNFGLTGSGWNTIARITFDPPADGVCALSADAGGQLRSTTTSGNVEATYRLLLEGGVASPAFPGDYNSPDGTWRSSFFVTFAWNVNVRVDQSITVALQVNPTSVSSWSSGTGSTATLTGFATFSSL